MPGASLEKRKAYLARLVDERGGGGRICHYTEALDAIDPGILPLVKALETDMTTPIFSCSGHWRRNSTPYVTFVVLPGKDAAFRRDVRSLIDAAARKFIGMEITQRLRPMRFGTGPFIDWKLALDLHVDGRIRSARRYEAARDSLVKSYAAFIRKSMNHGR